MRMLRVLMLGHNMLAILKTHSGKGFSGYFPPLLVCKPFIRRYAQADMADRVIQIRTQGADFPEFSSQFARILPGHVGIKEPPFFLPQVILQGAPEALTFDQLRDHGGFPIIPYAIAALAAEALPVCEALS